ncbi:MAG TPA: hypothetical protein VGR95_22225 [Thermoanaerobaculia bacterium]|jgi:hypothetical protein|nr:hypothetical protein [Thermoanaerobaculia bacterium]
MNDPTNNDRTNIETRKHLVSLIARRTGCGEDVAAAARRAYEDLAAVLVPLISGPGFEALIARALQLTQREFPPGEAPSGGNNPEPVVEITLWLERQDQRDRIDATAAMFAVVTGLLTTLIGESLTTRYLRKAWPDAFSGNRSKGKKS